jgi:hypothetical protein
MFGSTVRAFLEGAVERLEFPGRAHLVDRLVDGRDLVRREADAAEIGQYLKLRGDRRWTTSRAFFHS